MYNNYRDGIKKNVNTYYDFVQVMEVANVMVWLTFSFVKAVEIVYDGREDCFLHLEADVYHVVSVEAFSWTDVDPCPPKQSGQVSGSCNIVSQAL